MKIIRNCLKNTVFLATGLFALPLLVQAQPTAHYAPGTEGIKAASLPPPGIYLRDYNSFYYADRLNLANGDKNTLAEPTKAFIYAQVPRLIWITDLQLLGGNIGVDGLVPIEYKDLKINTPGGLFNDQTFSVGDVFAEVTWSKHIQQFDFSAGYGAWAPTGDYHNPTQAGLGYWTHMLTAGATWYIDSDKKWAFSALNRYEFNMENERTEITTGQAYTVEGGLSYTVCKNVDIGGIADYQQKVTTDSGSPSASKERDRVAAAGPEISAFCSKLGLITSLRYEYEFLAESRLQGHTVTLTLTYRF